MSPRAKRLALTSPPVGLLVLGRMTLGDGADHVAHDTRLTHAYQLARELVDATPAAEDFVGSSEELATTKERADTASRRNDIKVAVSAATWRSKLRDALDSAEFDGQERGFTLGFATAYYMLVEMHARPGGAR